MSPIIPIFQLESNEPILEVSFLENNPIKDFGNGLLISSDGIFMTVAHVLKPLTGFNHYSLVKGNLFKIKIIDKRHTEEDENHLDLAIGYISIKVEKYFGVETFGSVSNDSALMICGFSKMFAKNLFPDQFTITKPDTYFYEIPCKCINLTYNYERFLGNIRIMKNSFTFDFQVSPFQLTSMSGSPIFNANKSVVGLFKGIGELPTLKGHAVHLDTIKTMVQNYNNTA